MTEDISISEVSVSETSDDNPEHDFITVVCLHCGHTIKVPVYCGNRFCNICSNPRRNRVKSRIQYLIKNRPVMKGTLLKHLTLTVKNQTDLPAMVKHLISSFRRLRQRKYFKQHVIGGAFVVELTNKGNDWHAHIHCIIQSYRIDWTTLRDLWKVCSRGNTGVWIDNIPPIQAVWYLTKYVTKTDLPPELQLIASDALKGYRLFNPFGKWYAISNAYVHPPSPCPSCKSFVGYLPLDILFRNTS